MLSADLYVICLNAKNTSSEDEYFVLKIIPRDTHFWEVAPQTLEG